MYSNNEEICKCIQNNDPLAFQELLNRNLKLLYSLLNRFKYSKNEKEDLFSCAKIGLFKAAQNFDTTLGNQFTTYAVPLILGEIRKYFRDNFQVHVSRSYRELYSQCLKTQEELETSLQRNVSLQEISRKMEVSFEDVLIAYESHFNSLSLDAPLNDDDSNSLSDIIAKEDESVKNELNIALSSLSSKERLIIEMRYFEGYTQQEVAARFFISQVQISRIEKKILEKLKINM